MSKFYAGIGARNTPDYILNYMSMISSKLESDGYILRSGGAIGADSAFSNGITNKEIFRGNDATNESMIHASEFHPAWDNLNLFTKRLQARNSLIMLGKNLDIPVKFVVCWTRNGEIIGGTGQALRISNYYNIPVFNLFNLDVIERFNKYLNIKPIPNVL